MFENKIIQGTHATRIIMSWIRSGGKIYGGRDSRDDFNNWLESLGLTETEIDDIIEIAANGKMELEVSASIYLKKNGLK